MISMKVYLGIFSVFCAVKIGFSQFECFSCQGGYQTPCGAATSLGAVELCEGPNAQCYEAIVHYQSGAIRYVERRCWKPNNSSRTTDFCTSFNNPNGKLIYCKTCRTANCNTHPFGTCGMKDPLTGLQFQTFHYVGPGLIES